MADGFPGASGFAAVLAQALAITAWFPAVKAR